MKFLVISTMVLLSMFPNSCNFHQNSNIPTEFNVPIYDNSNVGKNLLKIDQYIYDKLSFINFETTIQELNETLGQEPKDITSGVHLYMYFIENVENNQTYILSVHSFPTVDARTDIQYQNSDKDEFKSIEIFKNYEEYTKIKNEINFNGLSDGYIEKKLGFIKAYMKSEDIVKEIGKPDIDSEENNYFTYHFCNDNTSYILDLNFENNLLTRATLSRDKKEGTSEEWILLNLDTNLKPKP